MEISQTTQESEKRKFQSILVVLKYNKREKSCFLFDLIDRSIVWKVLKIRI